MLFPHDRHLVSFVYPLASTAEAGVEAETVKLTCEGDVSSSN